MRPERQRVLRVQLWVRRRPVPRVPLRPVPQWCSGCRSSRGRADGFDSQQQITDVEAGAGRHVDSGDLAGYGCRNFSNSLIGFHFADNGTFDDGVADFDSDAGDVHFGDAFGNFRESEFEGGTGSGCGCWWRRCGSGCRCGWSRSLSSSGRCSRFGRCSGSAGGRGFNFQNGGAGADGHPGADQQSGDLPGVRAGNLCHGLVRLDLADNRSGFDHITLFDADIRDID